MFWNVVLEEMQKGNFSFAIFIVGLIQTPVMIATLVFTIKAFMRKRRNK